MLLSSAVVRDKICRDKSSKFSNETLRSRISFIKLEERGIPLENFRRQLIKVWIMTHYHESPPIVLGVRARKRGRRKKIEEKRREERN